MELIFDDFTKYLRSPPKLSDMVLEAKDNRSAKHSLLIIIPSYHDNMRLEKQLKCLKKQKFQDFDVAIIFAGDDKFIDADGLSLYQIRRKTDCGFAGSVYTGQLFALAEGYKYYLFTDVDRVPHAEDSLGKMYSAAEESNADFVFGNNLVKGYFLQHGGFFDFANPKTVRSTCVFGLIRSSTLFKSGLYALPLYIGYEDAEFEYRLTKAAKGKHINETIYESYNSPAKVPFLNNFSADAMGHMYVYPTLTCIYNSPQTSNHLGFMRKARMFFVMLLTQKFAALRVPALSLWEKNARKCMCAKTRATRVSEDISVRVAPSQLPQDYSTYTSNAPSSNLLRMLKCVLTHSHNYSTSNYSPLFDFFMHDSFLVHEEKGNRTLLFEWKRAPGAPRKMLAFLSALLDTAIALAKSELLDAAGNKGIFAKYGV